MQGAKKEKSLYRSEGKYVICNKTAESTQMLYLSGTNLDYESV